jgi:predicted nucleic acid-binding protein
VSIFVDSSVWFAAAVARDHDNAQAKAILASTLDHVTTDHILVETWLLLKSRFRRAVAEQFWNQLRIGSVRIEIVTLADLEAAWSIGQTFSDQDFSIVDRTSFAVMVRLGISRVASFDSDFAVFRYGRNRESAFEMVRGGHSSTFRLFHEAILNRKQITCMYQGFEREICPHILGHTDGVESALAFQFGGTSSRGLPRKGEWRCLRLAEAKNARMRDGDWYSGAGHQRTQRCVEAVYIDVNEAVPDQPGRR